jgi:gliding motility-associated lipoprotein GldH
MKNLFLAVSFLSIFTLLSCGPNYIFDETLKIADEGWAYEDTLNFEVEITDTLEIYNLYLDIEHATDYLKQNIYILIYTQFPSGERIKERVAINLADKTGQWYGDCNAEKCDLRVNIQEGAFFNLVGKHVFTIEQFMRINPLQGIKNITLRIEDTRQKRDSGN